MCFNGFNLLYAFMNGAGPFENKEKTPYKVSSFDLKHFQLNNRGLATYLLG